jgi:hypothetical protein
MTSYLFPGKVSKNMADATKSVGTSVLTSRKSSSTPSLPDATENHAKTSVASTEQAASADNLAAKVWGQWFVNMDQVLWFSLRVFVHS